MARPPSRKLLLERAAVLSAAAGLISAGAALLGAFPSGPEEITLKVEPGARSANPLPEPDVGSPTASAAVEKPADKGFADGRENLEKRVDLPPVLPPFAVQVPPPVQAPPPMPMHRRAALKSREYNVYVRSAPNPQAEPVGYVTPDQFMSLLWRDGPYWRVRVGELEGFVRDDMISIVDGDGLSTQAGSP